MENVAAAQIMAGREQSAMNVRQPKCGIVAHARSATAMLPSIQNDATMDTDLPRSLSGIT
jgi:hypothetical protein